MSNLEDLTKAAQDNILSVMKLTQTSVIEAVKSVAGTVERIAPDTPMPSIPLIDKLPTPEQGVAMSFDFIEQILQNQRQFAQSLLSAVAAAVPKSPVASMNADAAIVDDPAPGTTAPRSPTVEPAADIAADVGGESRS